MKKNKSLKVLMPVFGAIDFDGRVQRAAEALSVDFDVTVFSIDSGRGYSNAKFRVLVVKQPVCGNFKVLQHLAFWFSLFRTALKLRPDVIHAHDFFMALPGWLAAKLCGAKLVYDAHELIIPSEGMCMSRRERVFYFMEKWAVKRAHVIIAANPERAELMRQHYKLSQNPLVVRNITPESESLLSAKELLGMYPLLVRRPEAIRLIYQGDMSLARGIGDIVKALSMLDNRFELVLAGGGPDVDKLRAIIENIGVDDRVVFLGRVPRDHLFDIMKACDVGVVTYPTTGLNNLYCAPNKVYEYAQAGIPFVARANPVLGKICKKWGIGVSYDVDPAPAILNIADNLPEFRSRLTGFVASHTWDAEAKKLIDAYTKFFRT